MGTRGARRALSNRDAVAVLGVAVRKRDHLTRLWPAPDDGAPAGFLLAMLPMRLVALAMLWATSSPRRLAVPLVLTAGFAVHLLLSRYGHHLHWPGLLADRR
jgi:hypothetical protein